MTVTEWIDRYYRPERLDSMPGRRQRIIADREEDVRRDGRALISRHDSVTGRVEIYSQPLAKR